MNRFVAILLAIIVGGWQSFTASSQKEGFILDTDLVSDAGDVGAIQVAIELHNLGETRLIGIVTNSSDLKSAPCARVILDVNGLTTIPVGAYMGVDMPSSSPYTSQVVTRFGNPSDTRANYPDATIALRTWLVAQQNNSVTYVSVGFGTNIAALMQSSADGISSLTGLQLWALKIKKFVVQGGVWPIGQDAYNFANSTTAWNYIFLNKPSTVPTFFIGDDIGAGPISGPAQNGGALVSPSYYAYTLAGDNQGGGVFTRPDWDQMALVYAIRGLMSGGVTLFNIAGANGTSTFNPSNSNTAWSASPVSTDNYLGKTASDGTIGTQITNLMAPIL